MELSKSNKDRINTSSTFNSFNNNYLLVYSLMMAGDWLQVPYVYYLYSTYGYGKGDIGQLFITGFGSSMLFGTIVGSLAGKQGRKRACVTYCITYILSYITEHSPQYKVLMLCRILGEEEDPHGPKFPTKHNIRMAMYWLAQGCQPGDSLVFNYSGHGSQQRNYSGDEADGYDETLCPLDFLKHRV